METTDTWEPTHFSAHDGSPARIVAVVMENECGDTWIDGPEDWEEIEE